MDIISAFNLLENIELKLAGYYHFAYTLFQADKPLSSLFFQLSLERKSHVDIIKLQRRMVRSSGMEFNDIQMDKAQITHVVKHAETVMNSMKLISKEEAVRVSVALEKEAFEYGHISALEKADPKVSGYFKGLGSSLDEYLELLGKLAEFAPLPDELALWLRKEISCRAEGVGNTCAQVIVSDSERLQGAPQGGPRALPVAPQEGHTTLYFDGVPLDVIQMYRNLLELTGLSIFVVDRERRYVWMNNAHATAMGGGTDPARAPGMPMAQLPSDDGDRLAQAVESVLKTGRDASFEYRAPRDKAFYSYSIKPLQAADGTILAACVIQKDISDYKQMQRTLRILSLTDELTGLYNRRGFYTLANHYRRLSERQSRDITIIYCDLDNLKVINDTQGHSEGDFAIIVLANILKATYRDSDIIARLGGDEFAVFTTADRENVVDMIQRLRQNIIQQNSQSLLRYKLSLSLGTARWEHGSESTLEDVMGKADAEMYAEKRMKKQMKII